MVIKRGANVNAVDTYSNTPLHLVEKSFDKDESKAFAIAQLLINNGADVNAKNEMNKTPLDLAKNDKSKIISRKDKSK